MTSPSGNCRGGGHSSTRQAFALGLLLSLVQGLPGAPAWRELVAKPDAWFGGDEGRRTTENILSWQSPEGSWPKNMDTTRLAYVGDRAKISGTFDNGATLGELRYLARAWEAARDPRCQAAFLQGLDHIMRAQYPTGGWPQFYPPSRQYHRHITFNDGSMVNLMEFLREVSAGDRYRFVDGSKRQACREAFDRGVQCILKCQIRVRGRLTAWCAQHDELDYQPRPGRAYELVSTSGAESVGIVRLLMSLERPSPEVVSAVNAAVAWFESVRMTGMREAREKDEKSPKGWNKVMVPDPKAPPLWARFYEINTNRPLYVDRDGIAKYHLAEIGYERRNGYAWHGDWPRALIEKEYPAWKARLGGSAGAGSSGR
jgi:PelA/Pel-15E family pectate lyase